MEIGGQLTRGTAVEDGEMEKADTKRRSRGSDLTQGSYFTMCDT